MVDDQLILILRNLGDFKDNKNSRLNVSCWYSRAIKILRKNLKNVKKIEKIFKMAFSNSFLLQWVQGFQTWILIIISGFYDFIFKIFEKLMVL